jgi:hypothetical protein
VVKTSHYYSRAECGDGIQLQINTKAKWQILLDPLPTIPCHGHSLAPCPSFAVYEHELDIITHSDQECHDCDGWLTHFVISLEQEQANALLIKA